MAASTAPRLRKWYFGINQKGFDTALPQVTVAIRSALAVTRLEPHCLYNGEDPAQVAVLERLGARVIRHRSRLEAVLRQGYGAQYDTFSGHWLRIDIPVIETAEEHVLYTDIDVMFRDHPQPTRMPRYLAAAPERYRWRWPHFNSGVMVMNLPGLRRVDAGFVAAIERRMARGWRPPGHDQVSYNAFFRWRHDRLPHAMNWKPYWGVNDRAVIVHFHGPKPENVERLVAGTAQGMLPIYDRLWRMSPAAYAQYGEQYRGYLAQG